MWRKEEMEEKFESYEVVGELKKNQGERSLRDYATSIGCSASYLSQVYNGVRPPSDSLLEHIKLERRTIYVRKRRWK